MGGKERNIVELLMHDTNDVRHSSSYIEGAVMDSDTLKTPHFPAQARQSPRLCISSRRSFRFNKNADMIGP